MAILRITKFILGLIFVFSCLNASAFTPVTKKGLWIVDLSESDYLRAQVASIPATLNHSACFVEFEIVSTKINLRAVHTVDFRNAQQWNDFVASKKWQYHCVYFGFAAYQTFITDEGVLAGSCNNLAEILAPAAKVFVPFAGFGSCNLADGSYTLYADNDARLQKTKKYFKEVGLRLISEEKNRDKAFADGQHAIIAESKFFTGGLFQHKANLVWWWGVRNKPDIPFALLEFSK